MSHTHEHALPEHPDHEPIISRRWQVTVVAGNLIVGAVEAAASWGDTLSTDIDCLHNGGDALTYSLQADNLVDAARGKAANETAIYRRRKLAHSVICGLSLYAFGHATYDIATRNEDPVHTEAIYAGAASLAFNGAMYAHLRRARMRREREGFARSHACHGEYDIDKHMLYADMPSAAIAVIGPAVQTFSFDLQHIAAAGSAALGAWVFRPTKKNLAHQH